MPERIAPNPPSPFADADPAYRHIFPTISLFGDPTPGVLSLAGCERLAVVPAEPLRDAMASDTLPDGLCPACVAEMTGATAPDDTRPVTDCRTCDGRTQHDGVCAVCRQEMHEQWIATGSPDGITLDQTVADILQADATREHLDSIEDISYVGTGAPGVSGEQQADQ